MAQDGARGTRARPGSVTPGAPQLHADVPNNVCFKWNVKGGDTDVAFRSADVVVKERIINQRLIPNPAHPQQPAFRV